MERHGVILTKVAAFTSLQQEICIFTRPMPNKQRVQSGFAWWNSVITKKQVTQRDVAMYVAGVFTGWFMPNVSTIIVGAAGAACAYYIYLQQNPQ